jgi:hypothetical protein
MMKAHRTTHFVCGWKLSLNFGRIILEKSKLVIQRQVHFPELVRDFSLLKSD